MSNVDWVNASKLRMTSFRYSKLKVDIPRVERMAAGGHIDLDTTLGVAVKEHLLIVTPTVKASIKPTPVEGESDLDETPAVVEMTAVVGYQVPDNVEPVEEDLANLESSQVEGFMHMLEPMLMDKLKSLLSDAGARGIRIPPHVYVPDGTEPDTGN